MNIDILLRGTFPHPSMLSNTLSIVKAIQNGGNYTFDDPYQTVITDATLEGCTVTHKASSLTYKLEYTSFSMRYGIFTSTWFSQLVLNEVHDTYELALSALSRYGDRSYVSPITSRISK